MKILVTGSAGFIGFHLSRELLKRGDEIIGVDSLNSYYDPQLKQARLQQLDDFDNFTFVKANIADQTKMQEIFCQYQPTHVVNMAAQAGVRYSLEDPAAYIDSNLVGFGNILENCRQHNVQNLVFASSSSVYGANKKYPFSEQDSVDHPLALYGATKKSNEVMAHSYAHLFNLPCTGLRFFTVYGPWGRPDMALFKFTKNILADKPIEVYNHGNMARDFTYIDDIVQGIIRTIDNPAKPDSSWNPEKPTVGSSQAPYRIYNIGNGSPVKLMDFVRLVEKELGKTAKIEYLPMQPGDVEHTCANTKNLSQDFSYQPTTKIETGVKNFIAWYQSYYATITAADEAC